MIQLLMRKVYILILTVLCLSVLSSCREGAPSRRDMDAIVQNAVSSSLQTLERSADAVADSLQFPTYGREDGTWKTKSSANWVSGFYGGCHWYAYALGGNPEDLEHARMWTAGIEREKYNADTHDLGFRFMCTFGNGCRFAPGMSFTERYQGIRDTAAVTLSRRFHPESGVLSSDWDKEPVEGTTPCVIDIMMNLEILFEAALSMSDSTLYDIAVSHANTTWKDFVRPDGGTYHIVRYDSVDGSVVDRGQLQGDTKESTWSRGHAWLVYGLVVAYRYTGDRAYLEHAQSAADYFIANLNEDGIAPWDFQSEDRQTDVSASAVVASALYEMITYLPEGRLRRHYSCQADRMLAAMCGPDYYTGDVSDCLLAHSVQYYHLGYNVNRPAIFADYYFMEALYRYSKLYL